jgi:hypothetical protein
LEGNFGVFICGICGYPSCFASGCSHASEKLLFDKFEVGKIASWYWAIEAGKDEGRERVLVVCCLLLLTRAGAGPKLLLWSWTRSTYSHLHGVVLDGIFFAMFFGILAERA